MAAVKLNGRQKAAALLIALGTEISAAVLKHFRETEIETLTMEVYQLEKINEETKEQVLEESYHMAVARDFITSGGMEYARDMLIRALGKDRAQDVFDRLAAANRSKRFRAARDADPVQLAQSLTSESPQTIALILSHLPAPHAAQVMAQLPPELRTETALRIGTMDRTPPEVIDRVEEVVNRRLSGLAPREQAQVGGVAFSVQMLNAVDRSTEKQILEYVDGANPEVAAEIRRLMFVFDDLVRLDDRSLQRLLRDVDSKELALAMRSTNEELQARIYANQSSRAAQALREEIEIGGPVRLRQVEEAQQRIVATVRRLEEADEIIVQRGGEDALV